MPVEADIFLERILNFVCASHVISVRKFALCAIFSFALKRTTNTQKVK